MIYCVWYPSGGFGHFVNGIISLYGQGFARPSRTHYELSDSGNSHDIELAAPKYFHDQDYPEFDFDSGLNYSVLIDNGIHNETKKFCQTFADACVIKICYSTEWWPVVAKTTIVKAMGKDFDHEVYPDTDTWPVKEAWAWREKHFLYLKDHVFREAWKEDQQCKNLHIDNLLNYSQFRDKLFEFGIKLDNFEQDWQSWHRANLQYFSPVTQAKEILAAVQNHNDMDVSYVTDVWEQAVVNYFIWLTYRAEVPANDYADWFTNTKDIAIMLKKLGVSFDSN